MKVKLIERKLTQKGDYCLEREHSKGVTQKKLKADRNRPSFKIQYPMKNHFL